MAWFLPWDKPLEHDFLDIRRKDFEEMTQGTIYSNGVVRNKDRFKFTTVKFQGRLGDMALFGVFAFGIGPRYRHNDCAEMRSIMSGTEVFDAGMDFINLRNIYKSMVGRMGMRITRVCVVLLQSSCM